MYVSAHMANKYSILLDVISVMIFINSHRGIVDFNANKKCTEIGNQSYNSDFSTYVLLWQDKVFQLCGQLHLSSVIQTSFVMFFLKLQSLVDTILFLQVNRALFCHLFFVCALQTYRGQLLLLISIFNQFDNHLGDGSLSVPTFLINYLELSCLG